MRRRNRHDLERVVSEVSELAAGQGFNAAKARRQEHLMALGYRMRSPAPGEDSAVAGLRLALAAALRLMRRRGDRVGSPRRYFPAYLIAEAAFGFGRHASESLMDRRNDVASTIGAAGTTFARYEPEVLREVATILVDFADAAAALDEGLGSVLTSESHAAAGWSIVSQERLVHLDGNGAIVSYSRRADIRSEVAALQIVNFWLEYYSDRRPGVVEAVRAINAAILRQEDRGGAHVTELLLDPALGLGERRTIGVDFAFQTEVRCLPRIRCFAISDVAHTKIAIQFSSGCRPDVVWYWNEVGMMGDEFGPSPDRIVEVRPSGYVEYVFRDVRAGNTYGLAWEWPVADPAEGRSAPMGDGPN